MPPAPAALLTLPLLLALVATLLLASTLRLLAILPSTRPHTPPLRARPRTARLLVVLGSGGHTHEMLLLLRALDTQRYVQRTYVVGEGDALSMGRAVGFERGLEEAVQTPTLQGRKGEHDHVGPEHYSVVTVPRARRVHQPLYSTPFSALRTLHAAFKVLLSAPAPELPHLIVTNGPGTAVVVILAALVLRFFDIRGAQSRGLCRTVYVESFARVKSVSVSGRLVVRVVDRFVVQWAGLEGFGGRAEYGGILV